LIQRSPEEIRSSQAGRWMRHLAVTARSTRFVDYWQMYISEGFGKYQNFACHFKVIYPQS